MRMTLEWLDLSLVSQRGLEGRLNIMIIASTNKEKQFHFTYLVYKCKQEVVLINKYQQEFSGQCIAYLFLQEIKRGM